MDGPPLPASSPPQLSISSASHSQQHARSPAVSCASSSSPSEPSSHSLFVDPVYKALVPRVSFKSSSPPPKPHRPLRPSSLGKTVPPEDVASPPGSPPLTPRSPPGSAFSPRASENVTQVNLGSGFEFPKYDKSSFLWGRKLGFGSYAKVFVVKKAEAGADGDKRWAIKMVDKKLLYKHKMERTLTTEYEVFQRLKNLPSFINMDFAFQDDEYVYFGLELAPNGELGNYMTKVGKFTLELARWYAAEMITACEIMHSKGLLHRDMKPENMLLDKDWHIKITDFGTARILGGSNGNSSSQDGKSQLFPPLTPRGTANSESAAELERMQFKLDLVCMSDDEQQQSTEDDEEDDNEDIYETRARKETFVGSAYYVSPEMLKKEGVGQQADLWAVGCILYKMLVGVPPFKGAHQALTFQLIQERNIHWPADMDPHAKDLIDKMLQLDPQRRIGGKANAAGYQQIKNHPFFSSIQWDKLLTSPPPIIDLGTNFPTSPSLIKMTSNYNPAPQGVGKAPLTVFDAFLEKGEILVFSGLVDKSNPRNPIPTKRQLVLTNRPRLFYVDASSLKYKGSIPWPNMMVSVHNPRVFYIYTPNRRYKLAANSTSSTTWKEEIQRVQAAEQKGTLSTCGPSKSGNRTGKNIANGEGKSSGGNNSSSSGSSSCNSGGSNSGGHKNNGSKSNNNNSSDSNNGHGSSNNSHRGVGGKPETSLEVEIMEMDENGDWPSD